MKDITMISTIKQNQAGGIDAIEVQNEQLDAASGGAI